MNKSRKFYPGHLIILAPLFSIFPSPFPVKWGRGRGDKAGYKSTGRIGIKDIQREVAWHSG